MGTTLSFVFFLSGAVGLLFETLWFRIAGVSLGNGIWASSLVLAAFMCGLGVGNGIAARYGYKIRQPIRLYALLELLVGTTGVAILLALPAAIPAL